MSDLTIDAMRPEPDGVTLAKAQEALGLVAAGFGAYVRKQAPRMPAGFWGSVRYEFQDGRFVVAVVEEKVKA